MRAESPAPSHTCSGEIDHDHETQKTRHDSTTTAHVSILCDQSLTPVLTGSDFSDTSYNNTSCVLLHTRSEQG